MTDQTPVDRAVAYAVDRIGSGLSVTEADLRRLFAVCSPGACLRIAEDMMRQPRPKPKPAVKQNPTILPGGWKTHRPVTSEEIKALKAQDDIDRFVASMPRAPGQVSNARDDLR